MTRDEAERLVSAVVEAAEMSEQMETAFCTDEVRAVARRQLRDKMREVITALTDDGWRPIEEAPKDGTVVDVWVDSELGPYRRIDLHWGQPDHTCGEAGQYCDSCPPEGEMWLDDLDKPAFEDGEISLFWRRSPAAPSAA